MGRVLRINAAFLLLCANQAALASLPPASTFSLHWAFSPSHCSNRVWFLTSILLQLPCYLGMCWWVPDLKVHQAAQDMSAHCLMSRSNCVTGEVVLWARWLFLVKKQTDEFKPLSSVFFAWIVFYSDAPRPVFHYCSYCSFRLWNTAFKQNPPAETNYFIQPHRNQVCSFLLVRMYE